VAIQGSERGVGQRDLLSKEARVVVAVSDKSVGCTVRRGSTSATCCSGCASTASSRGTQQADAIPNDQVLTLECDVVVPAATENVITRKNAPHIKAKIICEGANGPTTAAADEILEKKGSSSSPISWRTPAA